MKRVRFTEERIIGILRDQESGMTIADVCCNHAIGKLNFSNGVTVVVHFIRL
jgi:putative transposase